jgi:hypothetical protein
VLPGWQLLATFPPSDDDIYPLHSAVFGDEILLIVGSRNGTNTYVIPTDGSPMRPGFAWKLELYGDDVSEATLFCLMQVGEEVIIPTNWASTAFTIQFSGIEGRNLRVVQGGPNGGFPVDDPACGTFNHDGAQVTK